MGKILFATVLFLGILLVNAEAFELKSAAFKDGEFIPERCTGKGENISPALEWHGAPAGTKAFVLIMDDPDAPFGTWVHWVIYNIPPELTALEEKVPPEKNIPPAIKQGINSSNSIGYDGPMPPPGKAHRYVFTLYAVDADVSSLAAGLTKKAVLSAVKDHVLGEAVLTGLFRR